jgi:hypothetical protein
MRKGRSRRRVFEFGVLALAVVVSGCVMEATRAPYFTDATTTSERLNFATNNQSPAPVVTYGSSPGCTGASVNATLVAPITVGSQSEFQWNAVLAGLSPNTAYCYSVAQGGSDQLNGSSPGFTTPPTPGTSSYSFAVLGDWGAGTPDETKVLSTMRSSSAQFVVTVGDNVYNSGTETEYGDASQGNVFNTPNWPLGQPTPFFAAHGNHGFTQNLPYLQNFPQGTVTAASGGRFRQDPYCCLGVMPGSKNYASAWFAFDWGNARFYVLEAAWADGNGGYQGDFQAHWNGPVPGCPVCGTELQWLQSDLAAHQSTPLKFAFFHYPLHSDDPNQVSDTYLRGANHLEGVLANAGVKIAFTGHAHIYERNSPQISGKPMVSYITGTGGASLGTVGSCSTFDAYAIGGGGTSCRAPKPTSDAQVYGFLLVTVNGTKVTVTPTDENGNPFDVQQYNF